MTKLSISHDVLEEELMIHNHPLNEFKNVIITLTLVRGHMKVSKDKD